MMALCVHYDIAGVNLAVVVHCDGAMFLKLTIACLLAAAATSARVTVRVAPPAVLVESPVPPPGPGYVWTPGYYRWDGRAYVWVPGMWVVAPWPEARWEP